MKQFTNLTEAEKDQIKVSALSWWSKYSDCVEERMKEAKTDQVAPSGSDLFRPELWKGIHWRWFFRWQNMDVVVPPQEPETSWKNLWGLISK